MVTSYGKTFEIAGKPLEPFLLQHHLNG